MNLNNIARTFIGGSIVYVVVAACSATDGGNTLTGRRSDAGADTPYENDEGQGGALGDASGNEGGNGNEGGSDDEGGGWLDAALDAITDPVPDASADDGTKDGTRLKARYYVADDGARQFAGWYDTLRGEECSFQMAADGKRRCMPAATVTGGTYYADAACTQPLGYDYTGCVSGGYGVVWEYPACSQQRLRLYPILGAFTGKPYVKSGASCIQTMETANLVRLGTEIPASSFVAATLQ